MFEWMSSRGSAERQEERIRNARYAKRRAARGKIQNLIVAQSNSPRLVRCRILTAGELVRLTPGRASR
jgi:hypothetical protein